MNEVEPLRLRVSHRSEAREIAAISRQQIEYGLNWRWTPARVKRYIADPESVVLVASRGGIIQGFAIMKFADDNAHLLLLAVQPKARRDGIGTALLKWLEKSCITAGMQKIRLEVRASNDIAKQFYEKLDYRLDSLLDAYYDSHEAAVVMEKSLLRNKVS